MPNHNEVATNRKELASGEELSGGEELANGEELARSEELAANLAEDKLSLIDFDQLRRTLIRLASLARAGCKLSAELTLLRDDYASRIAGMTKAAAVARGSESDLENALREIESLPSLSAAELTASYRRAAGRFRDAFPASFGLVTRAAAPRRETRLADHK